MYIYCIMNLLKFEYWDTGITKTLIYCITTAIGEILLFGNLYNRWQNLAKRSLFNFIYKLALYCCTQRKVSRTFFLMLNICLVGLAILSHSRLVTLCLATFRDEAGLNHPALYWISESVDHVCYGSFSLYKSVLT